MANANYIATGIGTSAACLNQGGHPLPTRGTLTEEWNDPVYAIKTVTVS